ncbi:MAG TPA: acyl-ACP--UDP-N-acetylglucosamine O-acyltransferase [Pirellulaceae bacterium]|nr:acyl-ACP--UDP-N-acetylglucosamine O-acyltransferase [Pirellulaceae bacterium]
MASIHPLAVIHPEAVVGQNVSIGPFCVIEQDVVIGDGCQLASHVFVKSGTTLGKHNVVSEGAVLGGRPQHLGAHEQVGRLIIGDYNQIREHVTVHLGLTPKDATTIGSHYLLMVNVHVAHDCHVEDNVIMANNVMLAGHVTVGKRAYLSGAVGVHQFCRIGTFAMVGGQSHVSQDVPPYVTVDGKSNLVVGLNKVGLKRAGFTEADMLQLKEAYRVIFRSGLRWADVQKTMTERFTTGAAAEMSAFLTSGKRGFVSERRTPPSATIKIMSTEESKPASEESRKVG